MLKVLVEVIWIDSPFKKAPPFFSAKKHLSAAGLYITPTIVSPLYCSPIDTAKM
ncbi:uncharacterized protein METZ01_LOCUS101457, partial [marine metagenome]